MSSEFTRKQGFKLKKMNRPIYMRNVDSSFNKEGSIEHTVEVNIYYQRHRERTEIDVIGEQKQSVILRMPQLAHHNPEIDWRIEEVKNDEMSRGIWKAVETKAKKIRVEKQEKEEEEGK